MLASLLLACVSPPPDILLVTFDTTRADAIGAYGQSPSPSPAIDALAARGLRVEEAMTVAPLTLPAHGSILTGRYPDRTGLRDNPGHRLPDDVPTLAERLRAGGWRTGAFVAAAVLDAAHGLDRGFDTYADGFDLTHPVSPGDPVVEWPAAVVAERAAAFIAEAERDPRPFFAWVHFYEPHQPLAPVAPHRDAFADAYLAEIAVADAALARLIEAAAAAGRGERLVVAVTADHGEGRGEHGEDTHGLFVYRSTMRVPLVLAGPGVPRAVVPGPASVVDLAPTVLELAGLPAGDTDGVSLLAVARGEGPDDRAVYGEAWHGRLHYGFAELRVLQDRDRRYVLAPRDELYDWRADPGERDDLAASRPAEVAPRRERLLARREAVPSVAADDTTTEALLRLGYVDAGAHVPATVPYDALPDPKDHPDMVERFRALVIEARSRPPAEAVPRLRAFVAEHPHVGGARVLLSAALELTGDPAGARDALMPLVDAAPGDATLAARIGELYAAEARYDEARPWLDRAVALAPGNVAPLGTLAEIARRRGDCAGAVRLVDEGLARDPDATRLRLVRAACRDAAGDLAGAEADLRRVLERHPDDREAGFVLAMVLARTGRVAEALPYIEAAAAASDAVAVRAALGMAYHQVGRYGDAIAALEPVAADAAVGHEPPLLLADAWLRVGGRLDVARRWLELAEARAPGDPHVRRVRAALLVAEGDVRAAIAEMAAARAGEGAPVVVTWPTGTR